MNIFFFLVFVLPVASDWRQMFPFFKYDYAEDNKSTTEYLSIVVSLIREIVNAQATLCVGIYTITRRPRRIASKRCEQSFMYKQQGKRDERDDSEYVNWLGWQPFRVNRSSLSITRTKSNLKNQKTKKHIWDLKLKSFCRVKLPNILTNRVHYLIIIYQYVLGL
jgi:hypothetical protein